MSFRESTLTASKNCRICAYYRVNYFSVRWQAIPRAIFESDYAHAMNVWQRFSIRTLGEYSDLYLKTDVLLLADIFENFRNNCVANYCLDPAHYYTLPGFTWDAMLKHMRVRFELLTDIDMVIFIERSIRSCLNQCSSRYVHANNKYMRSFDPSKPSSYLMYYDVNNLYGWAMCQPLPYAELRWVEDAANFDVSAIAPDSSTGYSRSRSRVSAASTQSIYLPFCPTRDKPPGKREDKLLATLYDSVTSSTIAICSNVLVMVFA